jgi:hypothetical protein
MRSFMGLARCTSSECEPVNTENELAKFIESLSDSERNATLGKLQRAQKTGKGNFLEVAADLYVEVLKKLASAQPFEPLTIKFSSGAYGVTTSDRIRLNVGRGDFVFYFDDGCSQVFRGWQVEEIYKNEMSHSLTP